MALSKSLVQPFRKANLTIGSGYRACFAPYNPELGSSQASTVLGPTILDLQTNGPFNTNALPAGWTDLGWIKDAKTTPASKIGAVRSGYRGAIRAQYRGEVGETFEFKFREATRMAYKIASGSTVFNLLKGTGATTAGPLSASGAAAVAMTSYAPGPPASLTVASGSGFAVNDLIVCDIDYDLVSFGLVGSAGIPIFQGAVTDVDYIRKTSDFVSRVTAVNSNVLSLSQPFVGGGSGPLVGGVTAPPAGSKVQKIEGWAAREGGTFITEWSGLFIMDTIDGSQFAWYWPHVSIQAFQDIPTWAIENIGTTDLSGWELQCSLTSLAFDDPLDGETVAGYLAYYPAPGHDIAI